MTNRLKQAWQALCGTLEPELHMSPLDLWVAVFMARINEGQPYYSARADAWDAACEYINEVLPKIAKGERRG